MASAALQGNSGRKNQLGIELTDSDLRTNPPVPVQPPIPIELAAIDKRLPPAGTTILARKYKGEILQVQAPQQGFAYHGQVFKSLNAVGNSGPRSSVSLVGCVSGRERPVHAEKMPE